MKKLLIGCAIAAADAPGRDSATRAVRGLAILLVLLVGPAYSEEPPACAFTPPFGEIRIPESGFASVDAWEPERACTPPGPDAWSRLPLGDGALFVAADGPGGSGRFWYVAVGRGPASSSTPDRGVCFTTTTLGWRTLQTYSDVPLPWLRDRGNGTGPELVVWDSFPLGEVDSPPETAIVAWVYDAGTADVLRLDEEASRRLAGKIAASYRDTLPHEDPRLRELRDRAALALDAWASGACRPEIPSRADG